MASRAICGKPGHIYGAFGSITPIVDAVPPNHRPKINPRNDIHRKIFKKVACFSSGKNTTQSTTIYHAIHHNFTTNYHHKNTKNPQNPL
jgi:hypothetical protein